MDTDTNTTDTNITDTTQNNNNISDLLALRDEKKNSLSEIKEYGKKIMEQKPTNIGKDAEKKIGEKGPDKYIVTGVPGFDKLFDKGISRGATVIFAGGAGSGTRSLPHGRGHCAAIRPHAPW